MDLGSYLNSLVSQIENLFGSGQKFVAPTIPALVKKPINSPVGYSAPIHGSWASSGSFTYQPNATHPAGHMGVDMRAAAGTPVFPLTSGVVSNVGTDPKGGNVVNIQHPGGVATYYAHLATVKVHKGDKVSANTEIGTVGNTGNASHTFPHCHFQVWQDGQIQDPAKYFSVPKYTDLSPQEKKQGPWLSEQAKQEAEAFNMREHLARRRIAFSSDVDKLLVLSHKYFKIIKMEVKF